ncbi:hypothetical protein F0266_26175 [Vibrio coralliilyticus]|uniref:hypothetical protein n=1 Tax=Vibrio coralliilyticus TaxID=190893 RepID=UPI00148D33E0|nr:hypothetical protein [Vibrio coralliilyticus]NOH56390.1 hypothetical protein [Vibrio coralliilyticus]
MAEFGDLPFDTRPDLSPFLIHLTKNTKEEDDYSAYQNLISILKTGRLWGSDRAKGFIRGPNKATCFMDVPLSSLKYIINADNADPKNPRYEPFGVLVTKKVAYKKGCRPVLYLSNNEVRTLKIPREEQWRVVRLEVSGSKWISWMHEREWRCKGDFKLPNNMLTVFVKNTTYARDLQKKISKNPSEFKIKPKSIIPLNIMCEGLSYL